MKFIPSYSFSKKEHSHTNILYIECLTCLLKETKFIPCRVASITTLRKQLKQTHHLSYLPPITNILVKTTPILSISSEHVAKKKLREIKG